MASVLTRGSCFVGVMTVVAVAACFGCGASSKRVDSRPVSAAQQRIFARLRIQTAQTGVRKTGGELVVAMDTNGNLLGATDSYIRAVTEAERLHAYSPNFLANSRLYGLAGYAKSLHGICSRCVQQLLRARARLLRSTTPSSRFIAASPELLGMCAATAKAVGYPVPCPTRIPVGLVAFGGRPGCELQIIGPAKPCPNTVFLWRGWMVGSSITAEEHLVMTASPKIIRSDAEIVNGPVWQPGQTVRNLGFRRIGDWRMHVVFVPPNTNDGSAFASHVVLVWTVGQHTYAVGFHDVSTINQTLALDLTLARGIRLISG